MFSHNSGASDMYPFDPGKPDSVITAVLSKTPSAGLPENEIARQLLGCLHKFLVP